eukprot:8856781-Prorocentrum_lima.AAC.1
MTSSLVGSEMCIRDRDSPFKLGGESGDVAVSHSGRSERPMIQAKAVSYTHLTLPTICSV